MKLPCKIGVWLLPFFLTACAHKQHTQVQPLAPPIVDNPPPPPSTADVNLPPPIVTIPPQPTQTAPTPPKQPPKRHRHKSPPPDSVQEAANPAPSPGVSAIGQLSSGDPNTYRQETSDMIAATERGLNNITRPLSDGEQKIAAQIRDFLKQARVALTSGDVDGAHTLASKAGVLLKELTQ